MSLFGQTERGGGAADGGAEGAMEGDEGYLEVDCVGGRGGFDGVGIKDCVLLCKGENGGEGKLGGWGRGRDGYVREGRRKRTLGRTLIRTSVYLSSHVRIFSFFFFP